MRTNHLRRTKQLSGHRVCYQTQLQRSNAFHTVCATHNIIHPKQDRVALSEVSCKTECEANKSRSYHLGEVEAEMSEQSGLSEFSFAMKPLDHDLFRSFQTLCKLDGKTQFSSDDFRMYGLDRFLRDTKHGIGGLFAKWKHHNLIRQVGTTRSKIAANHMHLIRVYEFVESH